MKEITKEDLKANPDIENAYTTSLTINGQNVEISIDPDDVELEKAVELANKIVGNFDFYEANARKKIIEEFLDTYNETWIDEEEGFSELDEKAFSENLTLTNIKFLSNSSIDFFYSENGMFGDHWLVAQSFDGENFDYTEMYG